MRILLILVLLLLPNPVLSSEWVIKRVTDNNVNDMYPSLSKGEIVWEREERDEEGMPDWEIYRWSGFKEENISDDKEHWDKEPVIHNGHIAWTKYVKETEPVKNEHDIYYYKDGKQIRIKRDYCDYSPSIYENTISWVGCDPDRSGKTLIYWCKDCSSEKEKPEPIGSGTSPALYGNSLAYIGEDDEVYYIDDLRLPNPICVSKGVKVKKYEDKKSLSIYEGTVTWCGKDEDGDTEIYYWDGKTTHKITDNSIIDDVAPSLYKGKIAWEKKTKIAWEREEGEIWYWDGEKEEKVTEGMCPCLWDNSIAYHYYDGNDFEIGYAILVETPSDKESFITDAFITDVFNYPNPFSANKES
ncbi:MAG: hypothetical protein QME40_08060, partial [bacterium]|nr:hypothetical protein [bacterium]